MTEAVPYRSDLTRVIKRNRAWLTLASVPWMIGFGLSVAAVVTQKLAFFAGLPHSVIFGLAALFLVLRLNPSPTFENATITADLGGIRRDGELLASRDEIKDGFVMPYKGQTVVRLARRGLRTPIYVAVSDIADGRKLLRALGLDASQTVAHLSGLSQVFGMPAGKQLGIFLSPVLGVFAAMALAGGVGGARGVPFGLLVLPLVYAFLLVMTLSRTKIDVGADGIATRWMGKQRYFPYSQIERVNEWEGSQLNKTYVGVELALKGGETVRLLTGQKRFGEEDRGLLIERIREAVDTYTSGYSDADASVLGRNGREAKDWILALRAIGAGANADMRTAAIPLERLWRIIEDASASPVARAGAAIALAPQVPPSERRRIAVAADTTASPKLRIALERASTKETSDDELAAAVSELEHDAAESA